MAINYSWKTMSVSDESTAARSSVDLTVPTDRYYHIYSIRAEYGNPVSTAATSTGPRRIGVRILDSDSDILFEMLSGVNHDINADTAFPTLTHYHFAPGNADLGARRDTDFVMTPLPATLILPPATIIRVMDVHAADTASEDTLEVHTILGVAGGRL